MSCASSNAPQRIALVDCNNFYVSCERVFAPQLRGKPVAVLYSLNVSFSLSERRRARIRDEYDSQEVESQSSPDHRPVTVP